MKEKNNKPVTLPTNEEELDQLERDLEQLNYPLKNKPDRDGKIG